jgi:hypothetical protein
MSKITDRVLDDLGEWLNRLLDRVNSVVFIDAIVVKIRDGQVANRPVYTAIGVTVDGKRHILGLWVGSGGEGAKYWLQVLTEIKNRGVDDVCIVVCDGLKAFLKSMRTCTMLRLVNRSRDAGPRLEPSCAASPRYVAHRHDLKHILTTHPSPRSSSGLVLQGATFARGCRHG